MQYVFFYYVNTNIDYLNR